jgi:hypothetical protein
MEKDKDYSDRTPSKEQKPVPQAANQAPLDRRHATSNDAAEVVIDSNDRPKDAAGKPPRGEV